MGAYMCNPKPYEDIEYSHYSRKSPCAPSKPILMFTISHFLTPHPEAALVLIFFYNLSILEVYTNQIIQYILLCK